MDPKVKQLFVEALESGEYNQISGRLRNNEGFCFFGVLCDVYVNSTRKAEWVVRPDKMYDFFLQFPDHPEANSGVIPPSIVFEWAGLSDRHHPELRVDGLTYTVLFLNDDYGRQQEEKIQSNMPVRAPITFKDFAKLIREQW